MQYRVEQLAAAAGVNVDTVRFYQRARAAPGARCARVESRSTAGSTSSRLREIQRLARGGFKLDQIARLVRSQPAGSRETRARARSVRRRCSRRCSSRASARAPTRARSWRRSRASRSRCSPSCRARGCSARRDRRRGTLQRGGSRHVPRGARDLRLGLPDRGAARARRGARARDRDDRGSRDRDLRAAARARQTPTLDLAALFRQLLPEATRLVALHFQHTVVRRALARLKDAAKRARSRQRSRRASAGSWKSRGAEARRDSAAGRETPRRARDVRSHRAALRPAEPAAHARPRPALAARRARAARGRGRRPRARPRLRHRRPRASSRRSAARAWSASTSRAGCCRGARRRSARAARAGRRRRAAVRRRQRDARSRAASRCATSSRSKRCSARRARAAARAAGSRSSRWTARAPARAPRSTRSTSTGSCRGSARCLAIARLTAICPRRPPTCPPSRAARVDRAGRLLGARASAASCSARAARDRGAQGVSAEHESLGDSRTRCGAPGGLRTTSSQAARCMRAKRAYDSLDRFAVALDAGALPARAPERRNGARRVSARVRPSRRAGADRLTRASELLVERRRARTCADGVPTRWLGGFAFARRSAAQRATGAGSRAALRAAARAGCATRGARLALRLEHRTRPTHAGRSPRSSERARAEARAGARSAEPRIVRDGRLRPRCATRARLSRASSRGARRDREGRCRQGRARARDRMPRQRRSAPANAARAARGAPELRRLRVDARCSARRPCSSAPRPSCWCAVAERRSRRRRSPAPRRAGATPEQDARRGRALLASAKERGEHAIVRRAALATRSRPLCDELAAREHRTRCAARRPPAPARRRVRGRLAPATAARARARGAAASRRRPWRRAARGRARAAAPRTRRCDRGWYAGAIGWLDARGDGELFVALRCALLRGDARALLRRRRHRRRLAPRRPSSRETRLKLRARARRAARGCRSARRSARAEPARASAAALAATSSRAPACATPCVSPGLALGAARRGARCARSARLRVCSQLDERSAGFFALGIAQGDRARRRCSSAPRARRRRTSCPRSSRRSYAGVPLIVLTADRPPELRDCDAAQTIDQVRLYGSHVRWFAELPLPEAGRCVRSDCARSVARRALAAALGAPPGPVHLNLPLREPLEPPRELERACAVWLTRTRGSRPQRRGASPSRRRARRELAGARRRREDRAASSSRDRCPSHAELGRRRRAVRRTPRLAPARRAASQLRCGAHARRSASLGAYDVFLRDERVRAGARAARGAAPRRAAHEQGASRCGSRRHADASSGWSTRTAHWSDPSRLATRACARDPRGSARRASRTRSTAHRVRDERVACARFARPSARAQRPLVARRSPPTSACSSRARSRELCDALPRRRAVRVSNSMPVRDLDALLAPRSQPLRVLANRGANGIDGIDLDARSAPPRRGRDRSCCSPATSRSCTTWAASPPRASGQPHDRGRRQRRRRDLLAPARRRAPRGGRLRTRCSARRTGSTSRHAARALRRRLRARRRRGRSFRLALKTRSRARASRSSRCPSTADSTRGRAPARALRAGRGQRGCA